MANHPLPEGACYAGRSPHVAVLNCTVPREIKDAIKAHATSPKAVGAFITRLVADYVARQEEKQRIKQELLDRL